MTDEQCIEYEAKIQAIFDFGDGNENFSTAFVESVNEQFLKNEFLTERQMDAIDNIITKWRIEL